MKQEDESESGLDAKPETIKLLHRYVGLQEINRASWRCWFPLVSVVFVFECCSRLNISQLRDIERSLCRTWTVWEQCQLIANATGPVLISDQTTSVDVLRYNAIKTTLVLRFPKPHPHSDGLGVNCRSDGTPIETFVCMFACMYVCICMCVWLSVCVYAYMCVYISVCVCVCLSLCLCLGMQVCMYVNVRMRVSMNV